MRRPRGVRTRLLAVVVVSVALALALMTAGFNVLLARSLSNDADAVLRTRATTEASSVDIAGGRAVTADPPDSGGVESQAWVFQGGRAVERPRVSAALDRAALAAAASPEMTIDVPGLNTRLYAMPSSDNPDIMVVAGVSLAPYQHTQRIALVASLIFAGLVLLVVALVARWMLAAALRPVARMTTDAEQWSVDDSDRRFLAGEPHDELSQLAATLDGLLDRLAASLRREQRFSSELSHELRTPLAKVITEAELALRRERDAGAYREALEGVVRDARQMARTIDTLVAASRQEAGLARGRCDAQAVVEEVAESCAGLAAAGGVRLTTEPAGSGPFVGVEVDIAARILQPLVENACRYATAEVRVDVRREGTQVVFTVADDGPGVADDERERIFEPGVCGIPSPRETQGRGAGLGLPLARRLARAASGDVEALESSSGARFVVRLPAG